MAKLSRVDWFGLKKKLQSIAFGVTEVPVSIIEIPEEEGELGYTSSGNSIHLSCTHPIMDKLPLKQKIAFITGVFTHELMHRIATHFQSFEKTLNSLKPSEASIFRDIFNVIEDPAIEEQAKYYIGGHLLKCLHYSIMHLYKNTPPLKPRSAFSQFISALIMYGDGGALKGEFSDLAARNMFYKVLPTVDKAIVETDGKKRVQLAYDVFIISKPLWEEYAKSAEMMQKLMEDLQKAMKDAGKGSKGSSGGNPLKIEPDEDGKDPATERKQRRRKVTFRKVSKEEMEEMRKNSTSNSGDPDGDIEILYCDEDDKNKDPKANGSAKPSKGDRAKNDTDVDGDKPSGKSAPEPAETPESGLDPDGCAEPGSEEGPEEGPGKGSSDSPEEDESRELSESSGSSTNESNKNGEDKGEDKKSNSGSEDGVPSEPAGGTISIGPEPDYEKEAAIDETEYELSPEDIAKIDSMLDEIRTESASEEFAKRECYSDDLSTPELDVNYAGIRCLNKRITRSAAATIETQYTRVVDMLSGAINLLYSQMKRIINNAASEREYRGSGRISVPRLNCGRLTSRVFERNIDPADKDDMCVEILIDESGSMQSESKSKCAMQCAVGLTEVLSRLRIPTKVIGFTADNNGYDVIHHHYMHWLNTKDERMNLLSISHHWNNFDGYSIRYATEMLKKRKAKHKILIIISDGAPACFYYRNRGAGMADTMDAVKQAAKVADVIGVGVGGGNEQIWKALYGDHFIHVRNANELLSQIGNEIQRIMKRWDE